MPKRQSEEQKAHDYAFIVVGRVVGQRGVKGEVKVEVLTDFPDRFESGKEIFIDGHPLTIEASHLQKSYLFLKLSTIDSVESANQLRDKDVEIPVNQLHDLPKGDYYRFQIIGLKVVDIQGEPVGEILDILLTGSNDVYIVRGPQGEVLIPAIEDIVQSIDLENGRMVIQVIDGLL